MTVGEANLLFIATCAGIVLSVWVVCKLINKWYGD